MKKILLMVIATFMAMSASAQDTVKVIRVYEGDNIVFEQDYSTVDSVVFADVVYKNGVKNEFGSGRLIIGAWDVTRGAYHFIFRSDGTCTDDGNYDGSGIWAYDPDTKLLATTIKSWTWSMNIITAEALQGIYLNKGTSYGFNHSGRYIDANDKLIVGKWKTKAGKEIVFDGKKCSVNGSTNISYKINRVFPEYNPTSDYPDTKIVFNDTIDYILSHLSGGYIVIYKSEDKNSGMYDYGDFGGEYYYVTE